MGNFKHIFKSQYLNLELQTSTFNFFYIQIHRNNFLGNESCPQPQTSEHLAAIEIMKLKHIIILQNKIDLVKEGQAKEQHEQIVKFVQGTVAEGAPIIPISAQLKYNIEV